MEADNEIKGQGNSYDFGARMYDSRVGRWWSVDPLFFKFTSINPYNFCVNNPVFYIDFDGRDITPSNDFKTSTYGLTHDYLMNNNSGYKSLLGKFVFDNKFNLSLGTDDSKVNQGAGASTNYKTKWNPSTKVITSAESESNFNSEEGRKDVTLWHFYIVVHEAGHTAEALNSALSLRNANHNGHSDQLPQLISVFKELSDELKIGLSDTQIKELSLFGSEDSGKFKNYISDLSKTNKTSVEDETLEYNARIENILSIKIKLPESSKSNSPINTPTPNKKEVEQKNPFEGGL
jgi:RHS repeat-associated protein